MSDYNIRRSQADTLMLLYVTREEKLLTMLEVVDVQRVSTYSKSHPQDEN